MKRNLSRSGLSDVGLQLNGLLRLGAVSSDFDSPPLELAIVVLEGDTSSVNTTKQWSDAQFVLMSLMALDGNFLLTDSVLKISPNGESLLLV